MTTTATQTDSTDTVEEPTLDIVIPPSEDNEEPDGPELDYEKAFTKLPAHIRKAAELFGYKPTAESQEKLEEAVSKLKSDYETELNNSVVPLIVAKMKGEKKVEKPGVPSTSSQPRRRTTAPYRGF